MAQVDAHKFNEFLYSDWDLFGTLIESRFVNAVEDDIFSRRIVDGL